MKKILSGILISLAMLAGATGSLLALEDTTPAVEEDFANYIDSTVAEDSHQAIAKDTAEEIEVAHTDEADDHSPESAHPIHFGYVFLMLAIVLVFGKIANIVEKYGQPAVIGELLAGIALSAAGYYGLDIIMDIKDSEAVQFVSSFGALLLLFLIGLESNIKEMTKVGTSAVRVAIIGVTLPFIVGAYVLGPLFYGDVEANAHLFLGAALVATSVGIPSSVLRGMKLTKTKAAQTFLGATVIDDIVGLIILAVVSALATGDEASLALVLELTAKSVGFLAGALILGNLLAKPISRAFSAIHTGIGMKMSVAITFALVFGYAAEKFGLEPIIGAFAAGLLLDDVVFKDYADPEVVDELKAIKFKDRSARAKLMRVVKHHSQAHVEDLVSNLSLIFIPVFFVSIGLQVDFGSLLQPKLYVISFIIAVVAFFTKFLAGFGAQTDTRTKMFIGSCMVPRGEVGLIFAATGKSLGVLDDELFSVILIVVMLTTFVAPFLIKKFATDIK